MRESAQIQHPYDCPFYHQKWFVVLLLFFFWPVGLILLWTSPLTSLTGRVVWTTLIAFGVFLMSVMFFGIFSAMSKTRDQSVSYSAARAIAEPAARQASATDSTQNATTTEPAPSQSGAAPPASGASVTIEDIDAKVTESNNTWVKFSWKLTLQNSSSRAATIDATIQFLDKDNFVVDDDYAYGLVMPAGETQTFSGYALIDAKSAEQVKQVEAQIRR